MRSLRDLLSLVAGHPHVRPQVSAPAVHPPLHLLTVEEALQISGRGLLLTPGLRQLAGVTLGDRVRLEPPHGDPFESVVKGIDAVHNRSAKEPEVLLFVTLPGSLGKESAPKGTKVVWLGQSEKPPGGP